MSEQRSPQPGAPTAGRVVVTVLSSPARARRLVDELAAFAVPATLDEVDDGWAVSVPKAQRELAASVCEVEALGLKPTPIRASSPRTDSSLRTDSPRTTPPRRRSGTVAAVAVTAALSGLVGWAAARPATADASHWSASGRAYHSDDDGDGTVDRLVIRGADGVPTAVWLDRDRDGTFDRVIRMDGATGEVAELHDDDGDGFPDRMRSVDGRGGRVDRSL